MNTLMISESNYPQDIRIKQEAELLIKNGYNVSVIAIKGREQSYREDIKRVKIYRVPKIELFKVGKQSKIIETKLLKKLLILLKAVFGYGFEYAYFTVVCFFLSLLVLLKDKFDVIHTHNPPDTLFVIALFHKIIFGKKFIYDHHDLSPDLFIEKYSQGKKFIYSLLLLLEKLSCRSADLIIATNESYKKIEVERCNVDRNDIYVVRNGPDLNEMKISEPIQDIRAKAKIILCYLGSINVQDGIDYLLDVFSKIIIKHNYKDICLMIIGDGDYLYRIREIANELDLSNYLIFTGHISDRKEISRLLSTADIFVDAAPYSFLNDNSTFIKHMEYMIYQKPIVSFALKESMYSLQDAGIFIPPNDTEKMADAIAELMKNEKLKKALGNHAIERIKQLSWDKVSIPLIQAYESFK